MKTIQERAKECYPPEIMCDGGSGERGYVKGATEQNKLIRDRLIAMQGEYITLELINELFEDGKY